MALHAETVTVIERTEDGVDSNGLPKITTTRHVVELVNVQPLSGDSGDSLGEHVPITGLWRVSTDSPEDWIRHEDAVEWRGQTYEVWREPSTFWAINPHTEFLMTKTRG